MKYLGIDYGSKRVGFAESDEDGTFAFPLMISENNKDLLRDTLEIIKAMNIATVVIGLSLDLKGKENPIAKEAKFFGEEIKNSNDLVNVVYEKEWLTTVEARRQPDASHEVDDAAAALILQRYLDKVGPKTFVEEIEDDEETIEEKLV